MTPRPPSPPPSLPGYDFERLLGSGGFADVFLYRQLRPQRRVAIKVLLASILDDTVRQQFESEANVMATMSTHPSIVTIYQADVSSEHRPYIVMEFCSRPNYGVRFRKERISVSEALRVGVQIAGAVETAHRAGILHRDIKPANILVTDYNRPALTDFGISITSGQGHDIEDSQGMSIPWSPPEFFADPPRADVRSDVFSLAATVYSLLASHTPFERVGQRNTAADLITRIETEPLRPLSRPDVPPELNRVLSVAMAKDPSGRYDSALAFGRALQQAEMALSLPVTQMDVLDDRGATTADADGDDELESHTRIRKVATVDPTGPASPGTTGEPSKPQLDRYAGVAPALSSPMSAPSSMSALDQTQSGESTVLRPAGAALPRAHTPMSANEWAAPAPQDDTPTRRTPVWPFVLIAGFLVIALGVGSTLLVRSMFGDEKDDPAPAPPPVAGPTSISPPGDLSVKLIVPEEHGLGGRAQVVWSLPPEATADVYYAVQWQDLPENYQDYSEPVEVYGRNSTVLNVPPNLPERCVRVRAMTKDGTTSAWATTCLEGT